MARFIKHTGRQVDPWEVFHQEARTNSAGDKRTYHDLAEAANRGDREAMDKLVTSRLLLISKTVCEQCHPQRGADDLIQEVAICLMLKAREGRLDPNVTDKGFNEYVARLTRWKVNNFLTTTGRRHKREQSVAMEQQFREPQLDDPLQTLIDHENKDMIGQALQACDERPRRILETQFLQEEPISDAELANEYRCSASGIGAMRRKTLFSLRTALGPHFPERTEERIPSSPRPSQKKLAFAQMLLQEIQRDSSSSVPMSAPENIASDVLHLSLSLIDNILSERERSVIKHLFLTTYEHEEKTQEDVAYLLRMAQTTVRSLTRSAVRKLATRLKQLMQEENDTSAA